MIVIIFIMVNLFVDANCDAFNFGLYSNISIVVLNVCLVNCKGDLMFMRLCL